MWRRCVFIGVSHAPVLAGPKRPHFGTPYSYAQTVAPREMKFGVITREEDRVSWIRYAPIPKGGAQASPKFFGTPTPKRFDLQRRNMA